MFVYVKWFFVLNFEVVGVFCVCKYEFVVCFGVMDDYGMLVILFLLVCFVDDYLDVWIEIEIGLIVFMLVWFGDDYDFVIVMY